MSVASVQCPEQKVSLLLLSICAARSFPSSPTAFSSVQKMASDVSLVGIWTVKSILFPYLPLGVYHSVSACGWIKQISRIGSSDSPPDFPVNSSHPASGGAPIATHWPPLQYLVTATTSLFLLLPVYVSLQVSLCHWPVLSYFLESDLSASPWLMVLCLLKPVLTWYCHLVLSPAYFIFNNVVGIGFPLSLFFFLFPLHCST